MINVHPAFLFNFLKVTSKNREENYMNSLEYRHFVVCIFPMVMDMLSALDQIWVKLDNDTYNERITKTKKIRKGREVTCYGVTPLDKSIFIEYLGKEGFIPVINYIIQTLKNLCPDTVQSSLDLYGCAQAAISVLPDAPQLPTSSSPDNSFTCIQAMQYVLRMGSGNIGMFNSICEYLVSVSLEMLKTYIQHGKNPTG